MNELLDSLFGRMGGGRRAAIVAVGVLVTAAVFGLSRWATEPVMVPLYADVPVGNVKAMTDKLTEIGIKYSLDRAGTTISVASEDFPRARVDLAAEAMPSGGRPGLELFDKPSWGMTDFTQKVNYRRALEGELERTIGKMKDIKAVQVHLAIEDEQVFKKNERPSKASVTLAMLNGQQPRSETVQGIASLVASSIGGLDPEHVTVVDERGQSLTTKDGSLTELTSRQLTVQREVESYMEQKADKLLSSLVGDGNARVQVAATINFDKVERTVQAVDPDRQALVTEQKAEVTPTAPQQGAGYTTTSSSFENTHSVESFSGAIGNVTKLTVAVLIADKVTMPAADSTATVPPEPIITARTPEEITRVEMLVKNALGVDSTRGDMISVMSAPFDVPTPMARVDSVVAPNDLVAKLQANPKPIVALAALVVLLIIAMVAINALKPKRTLAEKVALRDAAKYAALLPALEEQAALLAGNQMEEEEVAAEEPQQNVMTLMPTSPAREQAIATMEQRPDTAIRVMRSWIRS